MTGKRSSLSSHSGLYKQIYMTVIDDGEIGSVLKVGIRCWLRIWFGIILSWCGLRMLSWYGEFTELLLCQDTSDTAVFGVTITRLTATVKVCRAVTTRSGLGLRIRLIITELLLGELAVLAAVKMVQVTSVTTRVERRRTTSQCQSDQSKEEPTSRDVR